jgi:murein DD-endopeptidase MepM/ murein hydrolase activator NlpD
MSSLRRSTGHRQLTWRAAVLLACLALLAAWPTPARAGPSGGWTLPIDPPIVVVREFEPPVLRWLAGHRGIDLATSPGATVRATGPGVVSYAGLVAGRGVVVVRHTGADYPLRTTVEPVSASVVTGQQVTAGDPIGVVADRPGHCAPAVCLHWGLLRGDTYLDPWQDDKAGAIRLLPLGAATLPISPSQLAGSGSGVRLLVGAAQPFDRHVGVDLRGRQ